MTKEEKAQDLLNILQEIKEDSLRLENLNKEYEKVAKAVEGRIQAEKLLFQDRYEEYLEASEKENKEIKKRTKNKPFSSQNIKGLASEIHRLENKFLDGFAELAFLPTKTKEAIKIVARYRKEFFSRARRNAKFLKYIANK
jgi:hypothetical protein